MGSICVGTPPSRVDMGFAGSNNISGDTHVKKGTREVNRICNILKMTFYVVITSSGPGKLTIVLNSPQIMICPKEKLYVDHFSFVEKGLPVLH